MVEKIKISNILALDLADRLPISDGACNKSYSIN
jgi:hypothetical protein